MSKHEGSLLCLVALVFYGILLWVRLPWQLVGQAFVFGDSGHILYVADVLNRGGRLYADVFYNYGPLPAYTYFFWSLLAGNTAASFAVWSLAWGAAGLFSLAVWTRRSLPAFRAAPVFIVLITPIFLGNSYGSNYAFMEALFGLWTGMLWCAPQRRSYGRTVGVAVLLGLMQLTKFGPALAVGLAWVVVDTFTVWRRPESRGWRRWWIHGVVLGGGFLFLQGVEVVWLWSTMPGWLAASAVWPAYAVKWYASYVTSDLRFPTWQNLNYFIGGQLPLLVLVAAGVLTVMQFFCGRIPQGSVKMNLSEDAMGGAALLSLAYGICAVLFLRHVWLYYSYVWLFFPAVLVILSRVRHWWRGVFLVALIIPWTLLLLGVLRDKERKNWILERLPNGESLYLSATVEQRLRRLEAVTGQLMASRSPGQRDFFIFHFGSGLFHFLNLQCPSRHSWPCPGVILPQDESALLDSMSRMAGVIVWNPTPQSACLGRNPNEWTKLLRRDKPISLLSTATADAMAARLGDPITVDDGCWVFPVLSGKDLSRP